MSVRSNSTTISGIGYVVTVTDCEQFSLQGGAGGIGVSPATTEPDRTHTNSKMESERSIL